MIGTEDNNCGKEISRKFISHIINKYYKDKNSLLMFDFLGAGIGAEHYLNTIKNISLITLIDCKKSKIKEFILNKYRNFINKYLTIIEVFGFDINDFLDKIIVSPYDVFNLDFCTYFYDNDKENCTKSIIKKSFDVGAIDKNGLLLCTFQITGLGINMRREKDNIITCPIEIEKQIKNIAKEYGYCIKNVHHFKYKSSKPTTMINIMFKFGDV